MEIPDIPLDQKELTYLLYGGQLGYENFVNTKNLKDKYDFLKFRPETHGYEPHEHLNEEGKVLLEFIKLHKSKQINLKRHIYYLKDLTPYSQCLDIHFNLFKNLIGAFAGRKSAKTLQESVDNLDIVGSVLLQEIDYNRNIVEENVETIAVYHPETKTITINTPPHKAKLCRYYTPHSTHVLVFACIKNSDNTLSAPYPFFVPLRDPKTLELNKGITMKWLGPSFGGLPGREYAFEFKDYSIPVDQVLLDKYLSFENNHLQVTADNTILEYTARICFLLEQDRRVDKSIREALKAAYLTVRHANNRTQFQTLDEKGKERPIFEYKYNKTRIMKGLSEMFSLNIIGQLMRKGIYHNIKNPTRNFQRLAETFTFFDMFEVFVNERCLINIESFRESLGGIGYLKFSGIPTLQENAIKNAAYTSPLKEIRYLKFAKYFTGLNLDKPGQFIDYYAGFLYESGEYDGFAFEEKYDQKAGFYLLYGRKRLIHYRNKAREAFSAYTTDDCNEILKTMTNFEDVSKLCESFNLYLEVMSVFLRLAITLNRLNQRVVLTLLGTDIYSQLLEDIPFYLSHEDKFWPKGRLDSIQQNLETYIEALGRKSIQIVDSFEFNGDMLHSCISKTAEETYEKVLNMSRNHNPRNDPKAVEEIRKELLAFLNRPTKPKL